MKKDINGTETINGIKTDQTPELPSTTPTADTFTFTSDDTNTQTKTIVVSKDSTSSSGTKYYAVIEGKDYEMTITNGTVNISRTPTNGGSNTGTALTLKDLVVTGDDIVTATLSGNSVVITKKTGETSGTALIAITGTINGTDYTKYVKVSIKNLASNTSKIGLYADINGDGDIDGIVFADLAVGKTNNSGSYTIPKLTSEFKEYEIVTISNKECLKAISSGIDRFYVTETSSRGGSTYWYSEAYTKMKNYASTTSTSFGSGKRNTENVIKQVLKGTYGELGVSDLWWVFGTWKWSTNLKNWWLEDGYEAILAHPEGDEQGSEWNKLLSDGWFVPSKGEVEAMVGEGGVSFSGYNEKKIWTSSQYSDCGAWGINGAFDTMERTNVRTPMKYRLVCTF